MPKRKSKKKKVSTLKINRYSSRVRLSEEIEEYEAGKIDRYRFTERSMR